MSKLNLPQPKNKLCEIVFYTDKDRMDQFQLAIPASRRDDWDSLLSTYVISVNQLPESCTPMSVAMSVFNGVRLGLACGAPLNHAYLVAYKDRKASVKAGRDIHLCQLIPGYEGLIDLALGSGFITNISPELILAGEEFDMWTDDDQKKIFHDIPLDREEPTKENIIGAYCVWQTVNGGHGNKVIHPSELKKLAKGWERSPAPYPAMALKTPIRRAAKYWKKTGQPGQWLARAVQLDEQVESGMIQDAPGFEGDEQENFSLHDLKDDGEFTQAEKEEIKREEREAYERERSGT